MYESIDEALEELNKMLEYVETLNFDDSYHLALEFGHQFHEELKNQAG